MKKKYNFIFILFFSFLAFAQENNVLALEEFSELKLSGRFVITLEKGEENKMIVTNGTIDDISFSISNGYLKIAPASSTYSLRTTITAKLIYTESLELIDVSENAQIISKSTLNGEHLDIRAQEAAVIQLDVAYESIFLRSNSSSKITLSGNCKIQEVYVNMAGRVYNKNLKTETTEVNVLAGGIAEIFTTYKVIARVKAGSLIYIYGQPKQIEKEDSFGGKIELMN